MSSYYNNARKKSKKTKGRRYSDSSYTSEGNLNMWGVVQDIANRVTRGGTSTDRRTKKHTK